MKNDKILQEQNSLKENSKIVNEEKELSIKKKQKAIAINREAIQMVAAERRATQEDQR